MNLMKKVVWIVLVTTWLFVQAVKDIFIVFVAMMRVALGEDGEPASIITFLICMAASVVMVGFTGALIAALRIY